MNSEDKQFVKGLEESGELKKYGVAGRSGRRPGFGSGGTDITPENSNRQPATGPERGPSDMAPSMSYRGGPTEKMGQGFIDAQTKTNNAYKLSAKAEKQNTPEAHLAAASAHEDAANAWRAIGPKALELSGHEHAYSYHLGAANSLK